jgi:hypothetical protein
MRKLSLLLVLTLCIISAGSAGDDLSTKLKTVGVDYAQGYLQPLANAFGADINSGFFHGAKMSNGFHLYIGLRAFAATVPSADQTFNFSTTSTYQGVDYTLSGTDLPTIFGDENVTGSLKGSLPQFGFDTTVTTISGLKKLSLAPLAAPQLTVGTIMGTDFSLRLFPKTNIGDYGSIGFWGVGARHSISQYFGGDDAPVDIAVGFMIQNLTITAKDTTAAGEVSDYDLFKASAWLANIEVSKSFSILTLYGGLQIEKSSIDIQYFYNNTATQTQDNMKLSMDAKNTFRAIVGANLGLGPLNINADYNMGSTTVISGGIGLSF